VESVRVAVVGGGQAGLTVSRELTERAVEHVVLERGRVGQAWRNRWNSFRLVTPNWAVQLPGGSYTGPDPDGFMARSEIVAFLEAYATSVGVPIREGVEVTAIERRGDAYRLRTTDGELRADVVVLSTGAYQRAHRPAVAADIPSEVPRLDIDDYREPSELPDGRILIVGAGQSGCQIAEELHAAGREVVLSCGRAPWVTRRYGDRDVVWWMIRSGFMDRPLASLPDPSARLWSNPLTSGHGGGHDLHLRSLRAMGVTLVGRLIGVDGHTARFASDLADSVAWGDEWYLMFKRLVIDTATASQLESPMIADPEPFDPSAPDELDLRDVGAVLFAGGFRPDYRSWLPWGDAFDSDGFPLHHDGASTVVPGLYFVGVHFLRTRKSSLLYGVGEDAAIVAGSIEHFSPSTDGV
jgi:putative flavoprotein involved in K+ transport